MTKPPLLVHDYEVTMNTVQLLISFTVVLLAIAGSYARNRSEIAKMKEQIKHQEGQIHDVGRKMDDMKMQNASTQDKLWSKLDDLGNSMHRIELALQNKEDRK